jgi:hypothetical protein
MKHFSLIRFLTLSSLATVSYAYGLLQAAVGQRASVSNAKPPRLSVAQNQQQGPIKATYEGEPSTNSRRRAFQAIGLAFVVGVAATSANALDMDAFVNSQVSVFKT